MDTIAWYQIRVLGQLDSTWSEWFDGLTIRHTENGESILAGRIVDQAALLGLLNTLYGFGLPLIAVERQPPAQAPES